MNPATAIRTPKSTSLHHEALAHRDRRAAERRDVRAAELACHAPTDRRPGERGLVDDRRLNGAARGESHLDMTGPGGAVGLLASADTDRAECRRCGAAIE